MVILMFYLVKFYTDDLEDLKNKAVSLCQSLPKKWQKSIYVYICVRAHDLKDFRSGEPETEYI